jgi:hypothetical protein
MSRLILGPGRDLQQVRVVPKSLGRNEINAVLSPVRRIFAFVELENH